MNNIIDEAIAAFDRLSGREKVMLVGVVLTVLFLATSATMFTVNRSLDRTRARVESKMKDLREIYGMQAAVTRAQAIESQQLDKLRRSGVVRLFPFMEQNARQAGVGIGDMKERTTKIADGRVEEVSVDAQLESVSWGSLATLLDLIQSTDKVVRITKLRIQRRFDNADLLNATVTVATYRLLDS